MLVVLWSSTKLVPSVSLSLLKLSTDREGKRSTMETREEPESKTSPSLASESFCPHFNRNTCRIHFACCDDWYPCHKCHNDAITSNANLYEKTHERDKPSVDNSEHYDMESNGSGEVHHCEAGRPNMAETSSEPEGAHEDAFANAEMEETTRISEAHNDENAETSSDGEILPTENDRDSSSLGIETEHSVDEENNECMADGTSDSKMTTASKAAEVTREAEGIEEEHSMDDENNETHPKTKPSGQEEEGKSEENSLSTDQCSFPLLNDFDEECMVDGTSDSKMTSDSEAEVTREAEGVKDEASTSNKENEGPNVAGGISDQLRNDDDIVNGEIMFMERNEENNTQLSSSLVEKPPSPAGIMKEHPLATARDGTKLMCTACGQEQEFSPKCSNSLCGKLFSSHFCEECKLLIEDKEKKVDPYHCNSCGVCRSNKEDNFHCDVCNVCMAKSLKDNHTCFANRGHDPCAICWEEVFSGAVIFPCFHMVHKDCAVKLVQYGSDLCPMCRGAIFQDDEDALIEETGQQITPRQGNLAKLGEITRKIWNAPISFFNFCRVKFNDGSN